MSFRAYDPAYDSELIRGIDTQRPWNITRKISALITATQRLLDIGCGTCAKTLPFAPYVASITGVEPSPTMRERALQNITNQNIQNVTILDGEADRLPVADASYDGVISLLAPDNAEEIFRVLKPGGYAVLEKIGDRDKAELKHFFGQDEHGPRGQFSEFLPGERFTEYKSRYRRYFKVTEAQAGTWETYYSMTGLKKLLLNTPIIRNFDPIKDAEALTKAATALTTSRGICVPQRRFLIIAYKP